MADFNNLVVLSTDTADLVQTGQVLIDGSGDWQAVLFPQAFNSLPIVGGQLTRNTTTEGFINVRNPTTIGFEIKGFTQTGAAITNTAVKVFWIAKGIE